MVQRVDPEVAEQAAALRADMDRVSLDLHGHPETAFEENYAADRLTGWLAAEGFDVARHVDSLPTAFTARHEGSRPGPTIAILLEYDALPAIGHACGHNLIGSGGAAAAIAAIKARPDHAGTLLAIGTPGEEGGGGKIHLMRAGVFDDVGAALMFHPADRSLMARHGLASSHLRFTFHGRSSHAAKNPEQGRSALAAVQLFFIAVDMLRQFVPSTARLHGVILEGGNVPNVVPDRTVTTWRVRDTTAKSANALVARVLDAAKGAALATGCTVDVEETAPMYEERINNLTMAKRAAAYLEEFGVVLEPPSPHNPAGSSDIGNLSKLLPIIHPYIQIADRGTAGHSVEMREASATPHAHDRVQHVAASLAQVALDLLDDPDLYSEVRDEFDRAFDGAAAPSDEPPDETLNPG